MTCAFENVYRLDASLVTVNDYETIEKFGLVTRNDTRNCYLLIH